MQSGFFCSDFEAFVFYISLFDDVFNVLVNVLLVFSTTLFYHDGLAVLNSNSGLFDPWHMVFKSVSGVIYNYGNDGTTGLLSNLEASFVELTQWLIGLVSGAFRINED